MRIAFLGPSYPWRGGIAGFANNLGEKLQSHGHEVMMFTFKHQYPELFFPAGNQTDTTGQPTKLATQKILTPYNPYTWITSIHDIRGWNPEVIIVSYWLPFMAPAFGFVLRFLKTSRKIYLIHNAESHEKWLFAKNLTKFAFKPVGEFITLSETSAKALYSIFKQERNVYATSKDKRIKVYELFHPVYEKIVIHNEHIDEIKFNILFFGFIKHYKGLDILLEAMPLILKQIPQLKLTIAGDVYGDRSIYLDLINRLGIKANVNVNFNYIPDEQLEVFFADCDLCVIPYRTATQSGVVQMAFAYEKPVIASDVGGISEIVSDGENGFLVEPENPIALAEKIIYYYQNNFTQRLRSNILKSNQQHSWDSFATRLMEFIN